MISATLFTRFRTIRGGRNIPKRNGTVPFMHTVTLAEVALGRLVFGTEVNITASAMFTKATTALTLIIREEIVSTGILWASDTMSIRPPAVKAEGTVPRLGRVPTPRRRTIGQNAIKPMLTGTVAIRAIGQSSIISST
jgi:hypothetical protein